MWLENNDLLDVSVQLLDSPSAYQEIRPWDFFLRTSEAHRFFGKYSLEQVPSQRLHLCMFLGGLIRNGNEYFPSRFLNSLSHSGHLSRYQGIVVKGAIYIEREELRD